VSDAVKKTQAELTAELISFGWQLVGPTQTPSGWKVSAKCGNVSLLVTGSTEIAVLEVLVRDAKAREEQP
jgi:hypothetical protein